MSGTTDLGGGGGGTRTRNFKNVCNIGGRDRNTYIIRPIIRPRRSTSYVDAAYIVVDRVAWLEFNVLFQHKYGYIRDDTDRVALSVCREHCKDGWTDRGLGCAQVVTY